MKWTLKIGLLLILVLVLSSCDSGSSTSGGGGSSANYQFLYDHNANALNGHTVRWESNNIKVYTAGISGAEAAVNRWAGPVNFTFVGSPPSDGISFSWTSSGGNICGVTNTYYLNSGKITQASVQISINQNGCRGGLNNTVSHETAHALGFFGHTADGGLMDPDGGNSIITTPVSNFMSLLYSRPYGWDITPFLSLKINPTSTLYQRNGTQTLVRVDY
jgi:hypothetical protein